MGTDADKTTRKKFMKICDGFVDKSEFIGLKYYYHLIIRLYFSRQKKTETVFAPSPRIYTAAFVVAIIKFSHAEKCSRSIRKITFPFLVGNLRIFAQRTKKGAKRATSMQINRKSKATKIGRREEKTSRKSVNSLKKW